MKQKKFVFLSAVSGNILEYYDFTVYAVFVNVISKTFFPSNDFKNSLLLGLVAFALGFLTRPIGGIFFGYIGDNYGRRVALITSMLGMTIPTFAIGLIPSYETIGIVAPIILVICRLFQGLCISGEGAGAAIFVLEHYNNLRPGFVAGLVHGSNILGSILATLMGIFLESFMPDNSESWRYAFIIGGFLGISGFYLRLRVSETPIFKEVSEKKNKFKLPLINVLKSSMPSVFITFFTGALTSSIVYLVKSYTIVFYTNSMGYSNNAALWLNHYGLVILMLTMPLAGYLADIFGKLSMMKFSAILAMILIYPVMLLMSGDNFYIIILSLTLLSTIAGFISGTAYIFVISLFKPEEKFSGVAFSYNLGIAVFGGTSSAISLQLTILFKSNTAPSLYIITTSVIFLLTINIFRNYLNKILKVK